MDKALLDKELPQGPSSEKVLKLGRAFRDLPTKDKLIAAYKHLEALRQLNGGYLA